jgi:hypothetical protein
MFNFSLTPNSSDLSFPDFSLVLEFIIILEGSIFQTVDISTNVMNDLKAIPQTSFQQYIQKWKRQ